MIRYPSPGFLAHPIPSCGPHELPLSVHERHPPRPQAIGHPAWPVSGYIRPKAIGVKVGEASCVGVHVEHSRGFVLSGIHRVFPMRNPLVKLILWWIIGHFRRAVRIFVERMTTTEKSCRSRARVNLNLSVEDGHPVFGGRHIDAKAPISRNLRSEVGRGDRQRILAL